MSQSTRLPAMTEMLPFLTARVAEDAERASTPRERAEAQAKQELLGEIKPQASPFGPSGYEDGRADLAWAVVVALTRIYVSHEDYRDDWDYQPPVMR